MYYTAICAIAKDENIYLKEWVLYHLSIGFEHIILYDNNSKNPIRYEIDEFIKSGLVTLIEFPQKDAPQLSAYYHCIKNFSKLAFWIAFIDIDEFIVPLKNSDIKDFLDDYRDFAAVGIHWMIFGSSGHIKRPSSFIIENYVESLGLNHHIKSIIQPNLAVKPISPHHFEYKSGYYCVNEDKILIPTFNSYPIANKIRINHYYYKSQQDFEEKIERGIATKVSGVTNRSLAIFYDHIKKETFKNIDILKFLQILHRFYSFSTDSIYKTIIANKDIDVEKKIQCLSKNIYSGNLLEARKILYNIKRYYDMPELDILELYIYIYSKNEIKIANIFSKGISKYISNDNIVRDYYKAIALFYSMSGRLTDSNSIKEFIQ